MTAYYNEIDPFAAQWLRNLIVAGHIAPGEVDERSIRDVASDDLKSFTQCHFFAGIGIWSYALRKAGWSDERPVWTGSCPCQPFSRAGSRRGEQDERHLWPEWFRLIKECRPDVVFGEQVAGKDGLIWFDNVSADLENEKYTAGAAVLRSSGVGAANDRPRIYYMAHTEGMFSYGSTNHRKGLQQASCLFSELGNGSTAPQRPGSYWEIHKSPTLTAADGDTSRVGRLRSYGNAINGELAAAFIRAVINT